MAMNKYSPGCCCGDGSSCCCDSLIDISMVLVFIDEAETVYTSSVTQYDTDVDNWDAAVQQLTAPDYAQVVEVYESGQSSAPTEATSNLKPSSRNLPDNWTYDTLVRGPTEAEVKAVYDSAKGGSSVADPTGLVLLGVDVSGSMSLSTLGSGYTAFKNYLTSQNVLWKEVTFSDERWVALSESNYRTVSQSCVREFDLTFSGLSDTGSGGTGIGDCDICDEITGTYSLTGGLGKATDFSSAGWDGSGTDWPRTDDVPSGATEACIWSVRNTITCGCFYETSCLTRYGYLLARFKISSSSYKWRLIVMYQMGDETDSINSGWYWEYSASEDNCALTGSESWSLTSPSGSGGLNLSDFCSGTLSLSSPPRADI